MAVAVAAVEPAGMAQVAQVAAPMGFTEVQEGILVQVTAAAGLVGAPSEALASKALLSSGIRWLHRAALIPYHAHGHAPTVSA